MLRILDRYIFREIATTWLAVTMVLLMILLTNQFARVLGEVAKGKLPKGAAMDVIGLSAVQYLTVLVPIGLFLSIMLALGRLYRDSEMPAMMACRVGPSGVYRPLVWLTLPLVLGVAWLAIDLGPRALQTVERIGAEARREADLASIEPGRFTVFGPSRAVVYGERVTADGVMENVFLQRFVEDDSGEANIVEVVIAERGEQVESDDPDIRFLVLHNGRRYEGVPGTPQFRVVEFVEHGIPYRLPSLEPPEPEPREMLVTTLMRSSDPLHRAELQWRIGVPLSTIILAIFAVPLSRSQPRSGRYGRLALGLLVFIIYFNLLSAAKAWVEKGEVDPALGLWWVHGLVLLAALILLAVQNQVHRRLFR
ncbi:MAG: LPS export ABC transporter permease LptF [Gammaproteobacteria bacterium]|jgi:lipopolysaccharide export system permease protein|nr:LPS export ABC transporter permease LptF [Gammaproteobacteria bacterium]MDH3758821.1 LPS export ABC transporter permease LptF [Gammaproteobacteria bacterium]MDH3848427.1 LPS export ABC transporter permease LptF [Gammaproteobacteria bacterium]MDH3864289.1 LPS export ABC transporter permease LptF [Gammaproteobacteria bacterium]MDH3905099.1 LPS export ABC transporter permease LptF [Gammaproteobacteria bacterium]